MCIKTERLLLRSLHYEEEGTSVKNHTDVLIFHTQICAGAPQICLMADANLIFASLRRIKRSGMGIFMNDLTANIDRLHTTKMGVERIKRNLQLETDDVVAWCRGRMLAPNAVMERAGKNWYVLVDQCRITVNAHSYTIITAHKV